MWIPEADCRKRHEAEDPARGQRGRHDDASAGTKRVGAVLAEDGIRCVDQKEKQMAVRYKYKPLKAGEAKKVVALMLWGDGTKEARVRSSIASSYSHKRHAGNIL